MSKLCDRCESRPAYGRPFAFVCVECEEYLVRSHTGFLVGSALRRQREGEYLLAELERQMLSDQLGDAETRRFGR